MPDRWMEREQAIMNGLMSLIVNECDALECLKKQGDQALYDGIACKVRPTLQVCADEMAQKDRDLDDLRKQVSALRNAVETVIANQHVAPQDNDIVLQALRAAAPGHPHLPKGR